MNFSLSLSHQQIKKKKKGSRRSRGGGLLTSSRSLLGWLLLRRPFLTLRLKLCPSACSPALSSLTACTPVWCGVDLSLLRLLTLSTCPWSTGLRVARVCLVHLSKPLGWAPWSVTSERHLGGVEAAWPAQLFWISRITEILEGIPKLPNTRLSSSLCPQSLQ